MNRTAIMQPYFFPYIGYFQMINAVDNFVFYDDVNFINRGWINRNRILINGQPSYVTIPLVKASQNKLINEITFDMTTKEYKKLLKTIEMTYKNTPYFNLVFPVIEKVVNKTYTNISEIAINSIKESCNYLGLSTKFFISSMHFAETRGQGKDERLQNICKQLNSTVYINPMGGQKLYTKNDFAKENIQLHFIKPLPIQYKQFENDFVPWLSIIDVLMFNSKEEVREMLNNYELI